VEGIPAERLEIGQPRADVEAAGGGELTVVAGD
jgi:hypothetical protein